MRTPLFVTQKIVLRKNYVSLADLKAASAIQSPQQGQLHVCVKYRIKNQLFKI